MKENINLHGFIDKFIVNGIKPIVDEQPYLAFILLSSTIEFLGKCLSKTTDWQKSGESERDFSNAIRTFASLKKYHKAYDSHNGEQRSRLYTELRCAMVHALQPRPGIILGKDRNDLANKTIGCRELFEDVVAACEEVKTMNVDKNIPMYIEDDMTGVTSTIATQIQKPSNK